MTTHALFPQGTTQQGATSSSCRQVVSTSSHPPQPRMLSLLPELGGEGRLLAGPAKIVRRLMMCLKRKKKKKDMIWKISPGFENKCMIFDLFVIRL